MDSRKTIAALTKMSGEVSFLSTPIKGGKKKIDIGADDKITQIVLSNLGEKPIKVEVNTLSANLCRVAIGAYSTENIYLGGRHLRAGSDLVVSTTKSAELNVTVFFN